MALYTPGSLSTASTPRRDPAPVSAPARQFATFNPNGTASGAGQAARPGARPIPASSAVSSVGATTGTRPLASASAVANIPSPGNLISAVSGASSRLRNLSSSISASLGGVAGNALNNILGATGSGILDSNSGLFLQTFEQLGALGTLTPGDLNTLETRSGQNRSNNNDRATVPARDFATANGDRQPNVLRSYNHYNYVITLGILSREQFNTNSYRENGFDKIILQSGGGGLTQRQQISAEQNEHAEYYIENLNIDAVIAPNPNTGVGLGTTIDFEVTEPYSMGKFTEALVQSAIDQEFKNFTNAPFCLKIDFKGWGDDGENLAVLTQPYYIPIHFINVEFSVTNAGSRYQVKAIVANDTASSTTIDQFKTDLNVSGTLVDEILQNSAQSVTGVLNSRDEVVVGNTRADGTGADIVAPVAVNPTTSSRSFVQGHDRYIIAFPTSDDGISQAINNGFEIPAEITIEEELAIRLGVDSINPVNRSGVAAVVEGRKTNTDSSIFDLLTAYAASQVNEIGKSEINLDPLEGSNQDMIRMAEAFNINTSIIQRNTPETDVAGTARAFNFEQGDKITSIIQSVVIMSEYIKNSIDETNDDIGTRNWFRIDTYSFIDEDPEIEAAIGRKPRVYVYAVFPYEIDQAIHAASGSNPPGVERLTTEAIKEYNYIYTGKNEDVLDFNIDFNYAFLQAAFSDYGNNAGGNPVANNMTAGSPPSMKPDNGDSSNDGEAPAGQDSQTTAGVAANYNGTVVTDPQIETSKLFHDRLINSTVDMLMAEMTIWGDPYFLPSINGNFVPRPSGRRMIDAEGRMRYLTNEVFVLVNFLTPIDYRTGGSLMDFAEKEEKFSGLYRVLTVRNTFSNGEYKQELKLIRRHGQTNESSGGTVVRTSTDKDTYNPYASSSRDNSGRRAQPAGGIPTILPEFSGGAAAAIGGIPGILGEINRAASVVSTLPNQLAGALSQVSGIPVQLPSAFGQLTRAADRVQNLAQSSQQIFEAFSSVMPPQVLNFQSQFGQIQDQAAPARSQIEAAARSAVATAQRAGGAFSNQTPSALAPTSSVRPQARPINTQPQTPVSRPPVARPGQTISGQRAIDQRRAQQIDSQQINYRS